MPVKLRASLGRKRNLLRVHNANPRLVQFQSNSAQALPLAGLAVPFFRDHRMGMSLQPQVNLRQPLFQLPVYQMAAVGQEDGKIVFPPVFLQNLLHRWDGVGGVDVAHFKKQVKPVGLHPGAVIGGQADDQKPLAATMEYPMRFQARYFRAVVVFCVGAKQGQVHQSLEVVAAQVDFVVSQGHGLRAAQLHQRHGRPAPVRLDDHAFQVGKIPAVKVKILLPPVGSEIGIHPAQKSKIRVNIVGMIDLQQHGLPPFNKSFQTPLPLPRSAGRTRRWTGRSWPPPPGPAPWPWRCRWRGRQSRCRCPWQWGG